MMKRNGIVQMCYAREKENLNRSYKGRTEHWIKIERAHV